MTELFFAGIWSSDLICHSRSARIINYEILSLAERFRTALNILTRAIFLTVLFS